MRVLFSVITFFLPIVAFNQTRNTTEWVDFSGVHENKWLQIAPGKMGPNALPVPEMDYALVDTLSNVEVGVHAHTMTGDQAFNSYLSFQWVIVPQIVGVKFWAFPTETFIMDNTVRDERQIYMDDSGWITNGGDLWISSFIQILQGRRYMPDISINYSAKTTTGWSKHARYTDSNANYYYASFGKSFHPKENLFDEIRLAGLTGFYVWQTNKAEIAQDEGPLFELGLILRSEKISWANEIGGYCGYDAYKFIGVRGDNDPLIYRSRLSTTGKKFEWKLEYQSGFRDYDYKTLRFSVSYRFKTEL